MRSVTSRVRQIIRHSSFLWTPAKQASPVSFSTHATLTAVHQVFTVFRAHAFVNACSMRTSATTVPSIAPRPNRRCIVVLSNHRGTCCWAPDAPSLGGAQLTFRAPCPRGPSACPYWRTPRQSSTAQALSPSRMALHTTAPLRHSSCSRALMRTHPRSGPVAQLVSSNVTSRGWRRSAN
jgi:hypothetical protein